ncbi:MAG: integron [Methyloligella sp. ZOD6]
MTKRLALKLSNTALSGLLAAAAISLLPVLGVAQQRAIPVIAGQNQGYDACGIIGEIAGLDPNGDGFLAVRAGPDGSYAMLDQLHNGDAVYICDQSGAWLGVVYPGYQDCGVSSPWPQAAAYQGPCSSGWVHKNYVREAAG